MHTQDDGDEDGEAEGLSNAPLQRARANEGEATALRRLLLEAQQQGMTLSDLKRQAELDVAISTLSRWTNDQGLGESLSAVQRRLLKFLRENLESPNRDYPSEDLGIEELRLEQSEFYEPFQKILEMRRGRENVLKTSMPGYYLMIAFSSSWPRSLTISVMRIGEENGQLCVTEAQKNPWAGSEDRENPWFEANETYRGIVYGKSDMRGILCAEPTQNYIRHYMQRDKYPRKGPIVWMKGHLITTTTTLAGFPSPFYMERLPHPLDSPSGQFQFVDMVQFALDQLSFVGPMDRIVAHYETLRKKHEELLKKQEEATPEEEVEIPYGSAWEPALSFFSSFLRHAEMHFWEAHNRMKESYTRLEQAQNTMWMAHRLSGAPPTAP